MSPVQYLILNPALRMSPGKLGAQAAHASVEGLRLSSKSTWGNPWDESIVNRWYQGGHYAKIVLQSDDLVVARDYILDRGIKVARIIDEGRTEFDTLTLTALGSQIVDKDSAHVQAVFGEFKLYRETPTKVIVTDGLPRAAQVAIEAAVDAGDMDRAEAIAAFHRKMPRSAWRSLFRS